MRGNFWRSSHLMLSVLSAVTVGFSPLNAEAKRGGRPDCGREICPEQGRGGGDVGRPQRPDRGGGGGDVGRPQRPERPDREVGRPQRPDRPGRDEGRPQRPERPDREVGRPQRPERPDREVGRPQRPERPDREVGRPQRPERPDREVGRPQRPDRPDRDEGRPQRPDRPDRDEGRPQRPDRPDRDEGRPQRPDRPDRPERPETRPENPHRPPRVDRPGTIDSGRRSEIERRRDRVREDRRNRHADYNRNVTVIRDERRHWRHRHSVTVTIDIRYVRSYSTWASRYNHWHQYCPRPGRVIYNDIRWYYPMPDVGYWDFRHLESVALNLEWLARNIYGEVLDISEYTSNREYASRLRRAALEMVAASENYTDAVYNGYDYTESLWDLFYLESRVQKLEQTLYGFSRAYVVEREMRAMRYYTDELLWNYRQIYW